MNLESICKVAHIILDCALLGGGIALVRELKKVKDFLGITVLK